MSQSRSNFTIPANRVREALKAIKNLAGKETITDGGGAHFSWVTRDFAKLNDFGRIMKAWRWDVDLDGEGNVATITFCGEKLGDDIQLFKAIAPFVKADSFIEMRGEDGTQWRWIFDGHTCVEKTAQIVWND